MIIDSSSDDGDLPASPTLVHTIPPGEFNHGNTRNLAHTLVEAEIYIFLTQDVLLASHDTLKNLVRPLEQLQEVGISYGRQLPRPGAGPIEALGRYFTYPASSRLKKRSDSNYLGLQTAYCSNACAAYRRDPLKAINGFPSQVIMCEDVYAAAKMLLAGYSIYYAADAVVYHSHPYSIIQEFKRYFDLGVFYESREIWIKNTFGSSTKQGIAFFNEGLKQLSRKDRQKYLPEWVLRTCFKFMGYKLGGKEQSIPLYLKRYLSMHHHYWD